MTHAELVERAGRWLRNTRRCGVVLTEFTCWDLEIPDAIGWLHGGKWSILVECKCSTSDFYSDKRKKGRGLDMRAGVGRERYYMAERGVLTSELIKKHRPGWGFLEVCGRSVRVRTKAVPFDPVCRVNETPYLYAMVRRWNIRQDDIR
jgi:hypothetical protein